MEPGDPPCPAEACSEAPFCFAPSGQSCSCPVEPLEACPPAVFQTLPFPEGARSCYALQASADGSSVLGGCREFEQALAQRVIQWTNSGLNEALADVPGVIQSATSDDGTRWLWSDQDSDGYQHTFIRYLDAGAPRDVRIDSRVPPPSHVYAMAWTRDLSVVVGTFSDVQGRSQPFRWSDSTGLVELEPSALGGIAYGVSTDGAIAVGVGSEQLGLDTPTAWSADGQARELPIPAGASGALAYSANADGSVIVGYSFGPVQALRWTSAGVEVIGAAYSTAELVTEDGQRVFGNTSDVRRRAALWDADRGFQPLEEVLAEAGTIDPDWFIEQVFAASSDGRTLVGAARRRSELGGGSRTYAFRARLR